MIGIIFKLENEGAKLNEWNFPLVFIILYLKKRAAPFFKGTAPNLKTRKKTIFLKKLLQHQA